MTDNPVSLQNVGESIRARLLDTLDMTADPEFAELAHLQDLQGNDTGQVHVYRAPRLVKASFLSINVGPGRYFNIHVIPEPSYDIPRFVYEGMLLPSGSQVSMDLFPDVDATADIRHLLELYGEAAKVYDAARRDPEFQFVPSRQLHMRAFSSPMFLLASGVEEAKLGRLENYALGYLDAWLMLYRDAPQLSPQTAAERAARRQHMARLLIELDPDRDLVVKVYGESTTRAIEKASML